MLAGHAAVCCRNAAGKQVRQLCANALSLAMFRGRQGYASCATRNGSLGHDLDSTPPSTFCARCQETYLYKSKLSAAEIEEEEHYLSG